MTNRPHLAALALLVLGSATLVSAAVGCSSTSAPLTELVVLVRAEVPVDDLHVRITGPDGMTRVDEHVRAPRFPISVVLTRDRAPYGPVSVHLEGGDVTSDAITELVPGERRRLEMWLSTSCLCASCGPEETCRGGSCAERRVPASALPVWISGADAGVAIERDTGGPRDAGPLPDGGVCGCQGQPCCAGSCNGTFVCRSGTCRDCRQSEPTVTGTTGTVTSIPAVSATGNTIWVSFSNGATVDQAGLALTGGISATGTAPALGQLRGMTTDGSGIVLVGSGTTTGRLEVMGSMISGAFTAPMRGGGMEGNITSVTAAGNTITLTAWDGSTGAITFVPMEVCL